MENHTHAGQNRGRAGARADSFGGLLRESREHESEAVTALRADFVVKPETAARIQTCIEESLRNLRREEDGYLNGIVLISEQEARLGTVIMFWSSGTFERTRQDRIRWLHRILKPYLDGCFRVHTHRTCFLTSAIEARPEANATIRMEDSARLENAEVM